MVKKTFTDSGYTPPLKPTIIKGMSCGEGFKGKFKYETGGKGYDNKKNKNVFKIAN